MTNKKYSNEDIISSLELIATTRNCNECKIRNCEWGTCNCEQITANAALDLINYLQANNEEKEDVIQYADKEIKRLNAENERLQKEVNLVSILFQDLQERTDKIKAEAYKECIEKVKEKASKTEYVCSGVLVKTDYTITDKELDNLIKETETEKEI